MKRIVVFAACLALVSTLAVAKENDTSALDSFAKKLGYAMGADVGKYFRNFGEDINFDAFLAGVTAGYKGEKLLLTQEEIVEVQKEFSQRMQQKQAAALTAMKEKDLAAGKEFLAKNKEKDGVTVTDSGLQYEFIKKGEGALPQADDVVKVDYVGTLIDGTEFDSSISRGEPVVFAVNQVIPGWVEALQLMPVGSKVRVVLPAELAYGEQGVMPKIEPNSVLVFEITLHSIEKKPEETVNKEAVVEEPKK